MDHKIPPPIVGLIFAIAMWALCGAVDFGSLTSSYSWLLALVFALAGVLIAFTAVRQFSAASTTVNPLKPDSASSLVTSGIFSKTRNPMYLGMLLLLIGWGIYLGGLVNVILLVGFVLYISAFQIKPEEQAMQKLFGESFTEYCAQVRRWI